MDEEEEDLVSDGSARETRVRPMTTGKGHRCWEIKAAEKELANLKAEIAETKRIAAGDFDPGVYRVNGPRELEIGKEMRALPSRDIAAELAKAAMQVTEVASRSKHLKEGLVKTLKEAALQLKMGMDVQSPWGLPSEREREDEVARLRQEVSDLKGEIERIRENRRLMPPPPPPPVLSPMDTEEEEELSPPSVVLPPRAEWPPAIRTSIRGRRKILSDGEDEEILLRSPPPPQA